jgi:2-methylcitrate dehydratase PrpD
MSTAPKLHPMADAPMAATARLADFIVSADPGDAVRALALDGVLDTLAVTLAGGAETGARRLAQSMDPAPGGVASFWQAVAYRPDDAALLFGMASHMLDYDDVSMACICHPTAPVLSACLALPGRDGLSGKALLDAVAVGTEVMIRLGEVMGFRHYDLGFHATATLGPMGAAAACARLMGLDRHQTGQALSIAASLSSGLRKNFGSMVKSLHAGIAAANGLKAARLAAAGIVSATEAIDGDGFLRAFSGGTVDHWPSDHLLGVPYVLESPGFERKRYPCCYMMHKIIEGTLFLVRQEKVGLADVVRVRIDMAQGGTKPLIHPHPKTGLNALFSGPYAALASLADGKIDFASFTDAAVARPEIQSRLHDVRVVEGTTPPGDGELGNAPVTVTLELRNGASLTRTVIDPPGSLKDPITTGQLAHKWFDCLRRGAPHVAAGDARRLFDTGRQLATMPAIGPWLAALAPKEQQ